MSERNPFEDGAEDNSVSDASSSFWDEWNSKLFEGPTVTPEAVPLEVLEDFLPQDLIDTPNTNGDLVDGQSYVARIRESSTSGHDVPNADNSMDESYLASDGFASSGHDVQDNQSIADVVCFTKLSTKIKDLAGIMANDRLFMDYMATAPEGLDNVSAEESSDAPFASNERMDGPNHVVSSEEISTSSRDDSTNANWMYDLSYMNDNSMNDPGYMADSSMNDPGYMAESPMNDPGYLAESSMNDPGYLAESPMNDPGYLAESSMNDPICLADNSMNDPGYMANNSMNDPGYMANNSMNDPGYMANNSMNDPGYMANNSMNDPGYMANNSMNGPGYLAESSMNYPICLADNSMNHPSYVADNSMNDPSYVAENSINDPISLADNSVNNPSFVADNWMDDPSGGHESISSPDHDVQKHQKIPDMVVRLKHPIYLKITDLTGDTASKESIMLFLADIGFSGRVTVVCQETGLEKNVHIHNKSDVCIHRHAPEDEELAQRRRRDNQILSSQARFTFTYAGLDNADLENNVPMNNIFQQATMIVPSGARYNSNNFSPLLFRSSLGSPWSENMYSGPNQFFNQNYESNSQQDDEFEENINESKE